MFSVLICVYKNDSPFYLKQSLFSIFNQSLQAKQVVLVVDGPIPSDLNDVINSFKVNVSLEVYYLPKNLGLGLALNFGLEKIKYDYVFRMDSDDISDLNRFYIHFEFVKKNNLDISSSYVYEFSSSINNLTLKKIVLDDFSIRNALPQSCPFNHPATVFRKDVVIKNGGYENIFLKEDMGLWIKLAADTSIKMQNIAMPLLYMRLNENTIHRRRGYRIIVSELKLFKLHFKFNHQYHKFLYLIFIIPMRFMPYYILSHIYKIHRSIKK